MTSAMQWAAILGGEGPQEPAAKPVRAPRPKRRPRTRRAVTLTLVPQEAVPEPAPVDEVRTAEGEVFPVVPVPEPNSARALRSSNSETDAVVLVVPGEDSDRWLARMVLYAAEHGIEVGAVVVVNDEKTASADLRTVLASGQASRVLVAVVNHLPAGFVVVAASSGRYLPAQHRRPTPIDRTRMEQARAPWQLAGEAALALRSPAQGRRAQR